MLNVAVKEYNQSIYKTKHSQLKDSPEVGPRIGVEPTNEFPATDDLGVQNLCIY